jgi:hypothetical protein
MLAHLDEGNASLVLPVMDLRRAFTFKRVRRPGRLPNQRLRHKPPFDHAKRPRLAVRVTWFGRGKSGLFLAGETRLGSVAPVRDATEGVFNRQLIDCVWIVIIRPFLSFRMALVGGV